MDHRWLKNVSAEDKEEEKKRIRKHKQFLDDVVEILEASFEEGEPDYDSPSWAYKQADRNGANRKLREVIKFLTV